MICPTPQSSCPDLLSPPGPMTRTSRLSMKRLFPKIPSSSPPNSRKLVKRSTRVPSPLDPKTNSSVGSPNLTSLTTRDKCESGRTFGDPIVASDCSGSRIDSGHPVCPGGILSTFSKVSRSSDIVLSKEHRSSSDVHLSGMQPDVQAPSLVSTSSHNHSSAREKGETGREEKGSPQPFEKASVIKGEEADRPPGRRRRKVLRKRSHPCMIGGSQSTSSLGSSPSPLDWDGCQIAASPSREHDDPVHRNIPLHDTYRFPICQPQSVAVPCTSEIEVSRGFALEMSKKRQQGAEVNVEKLTPPSLIAIQSEAKIAEGSDESSVLCNLLCERDGSMKDKNLLRSASMSEILFSNPHCQVQNSETIFREREKSRDRTRQSLSLSIARHPNELEEEKLRKSAAMVSSKAGGGRLRKLMRKFSLSGTGDKHGERPPPLPVWAISAPMAFPSVITELSDNQPPSHVQAKARGRTSLGSSRLAISSPEISSARQMTTTPSPPYEIPTSPNHHPVSMPLDLHIVNPSVLDQACLEEDRSQPSILRNISAFPSFPKMPPDGEWIRSNSPDLELAALPPPRRAPKFSTSSPSLSDVETDGTNVTLCSSPVIPVFSVDNTINTFPFKISPSSDSPDLHQSSLTMDGADSLRNLSSCGSFIPSISVTPPSLQRPNCKRLFIGDPHNTPPLQPFQENSSETSNTPSSYTIVQLMPSMDKVPEATDPNSSPYSTFTRSSLNATPSVVFRPGTANTFGGSESFRPGTSDSVQSAISTPTERFKSHSPLAGYSLRRTTSFASTETPYY